MKNIYSIVLFATSLFVVNSATAQSTVTSTIVRNSGSNGITFNVLNDNSNPIIVESVSTVHTTTNATTVSELEVWYNTTHVNKANGTGAIPAINAANGWVLAGTHTVTGISTTVPSLVCGLNISIPAGDTFGFYIRSTTTTIGYRFNQNFVKFTTDSVSLLVGGTGGYGGNVGGPGFNPRGFVGNIKFYEDDSCTGTPNAGKVDGQTGFCGTIDRCYRLDAPTLKKTKGITYQWQKSTSATGPFTNVGSNTPNHSEVLSQTTYFRAIATCAYSSMADTTAVHEDKKSNILTCYCKTPGTNATNAKIDSVKFLTTSTGSALTTCERYTSYYNLPTPKVKKGVSFDIEISAGNCQTNNWGNNRGAVFVDFNRDGDFTDNGELVDNFGPATALREKFTATCDVPVTANDGITGLRVIYGRSFTPITTPCQNVTWGEYEDYAILIDRETYDLESVAIENSSDCAKPDDNVEFTIKNNGKNTYVSPSYSFSINGGPVVTESFDSIQVDSIKTFSFVATAPFGTPGEKIIKLWLNSTLDSFEVNDTITKIIYHYLDPIDPVTQNDTVCKNATVAYLEAKSEAPYKTLWFDDVGTTNHVYTGDLYQLFNPTRDSTFYVKSVSEYNRTLGLASPIDDAFLTGNGAGMIFDVNAEYAYLNSVQISIDGFGIAQIEVRDELDNVLKSVSEVIQNDNYITVPIGIMLKKGVDYKLILSANPGRALSSFDVNFPMIDEDVITIKGNNLGANPDAFIAFFNWDFTYYPCVSNDFSVSVEYIDTVDAPIGYLVNDTAFCEFPISSIDAGANPAYKYLWNNDEADKMNGSDTTDNLNIVMTTDQYIVTITNAYSCKTRDTSNVTINKSPIFDLGADLGVCSNDKVEIASGFSNSGYNHYWSYNVGVDDILPKKWIHRDSVISDTGRGLIFDVYKSMKLNSVKARFDSVGTASISILDNIGNTIYNKQVSVTVSDQDITIPIGITLSPDLGYTLLLDSSTGKVAAKDNYFVFDEEIPTIMKITGNHKGDAGEYNYFFKWDVTVVNEIEGELNPKIFVNKPAKYKAYVFNTKTNCGYEDNVSVIVHPAPVFDLGPDSSVCNNTPIEFKGPVNANYSYKWHDNSILSSYTATNTETVTLEVTDISTPYGCKSSDQVLVKIASLSKPDLGPDKESCNDKEVLSIATTDKVNYMWSTGSTDAQIQVENAGTYILTVTEVGTTCSYSDTIKVDFIPSPPLELGEDIRICGKKTVVLKADAGWDVYTWNNGFSVPEIQALTSGKYSVTVSNDCGTKSDEINVYIDTVLKNVYLPDDTTICNSYLVSVPNSLNGLDIEWSTGATNVTSITVTNPGNYWVRVANGCGVYSDGITIYKDSLPSADFEFKGYNNFATLTSITRNADSYKWKVEDKDSTFYYFTKNVVHEFDTLGSYDVTLTVFNYCGDSIVVNRTIYLKDDESENSSILTSQASNGISIYPNPVTNGVLNILNKSFKSQEFEISIYSIDGRIVFKEKSLLVKNKEKSLNVSEFSKGTYLLNIKNAAVNKNLKLNIK